MPITIKIDYKALDKAIKRLQKVEKNMDSALYNMGEALRNATIDRMETETDPDGNKWKPLNAGYASAKKGSKMLQEQGAGSGLVGSLSYQVSGDTLEFGTNKIYAAMHQFGGTIKPKSAGMLKFKIGGKFVSAKSVTIPARPFLGLGDGERSALLEVLEDHIQEAMGG